MTGSFREATEVTRIADHEFEAHVPDGWQQGRGAFGGVVFGILLRAARVFEVDPQRVARSFACDVAGPVMLGKTTVHVRELRRGRSQTNLQLDLVQGGAVLASGICTMSGDRGGSATAFEPAVPDEALHYEKGLDVPKGGPAFGSHYAYRMLAPYPFSGASEAVANAFVHERDAQGELDPPAMSALLDSVWPAVYALHRAPFAMTTVSYNAQFLPGAEHIAAGEPLFFRGRALTQRGGYSVEFRELWTRDRLIALNQQTFAVLG